jgi:hypothetical protein
VQWDDTRAEKRSSTAIVAEYHALADKPAASAVRFGRAINIHGGLHRPLYVHKLEAGFDERSALNAWRHVIVGQSIMGGTAFAVESFIDEVAHAAGEDAYEYRRKLLEHQPRMLAVLELAAEKSGWNGRQAGADAAVCQRRIRVKLTRRSASGRASGGRPGLASQGSAGEIRPTAPTKPGSRLQFASPQPLSIGSTTTVGRRDRCRLPTTFGSSVFRSASRYSFPIPRSA